MLPLPPKKQNNTKRKPKQKKKGKGVKGLLLAVEVQAQSEQGLFMPVTHFTIATPPSFVHHLALHITLFVHTSGSTEYYRPKM